MCTKKKPTKNKQATKELSQLAMYRKAIRTPKRKVETKINKPKL